MGIFTYIERKLEKLPVIGGALREMRYNDEYMAIHGHVPQEDPDKYNTDLICRRI